MPIGYPTIQLNSLTLPVLRFHQTLKNMMITHCFEVSKDWDEGVHLLRESVHEALGFSSFELVFGHDPWGPPKLLKEAWLTVDPLEHIITQVSDAHHRLLKATEFAQKNRHKET